MQIRLDKWTDDAKTALEGAIHESNRFKHGYLGTEHLLAGLFNGPNRAAEALASLGLTHAEVLGAILQIVGDGSSPRSSTPPLTPRAQKVTELALREALAAGSTRVEAEHVLLAILREGHGVAARILFDAGLTPERVRNELSTLAARAVEPETSVTFLIIDDPAARQPETKDREVVEQKLHKVLLNDGEWHNVIRPEWLVDADGKNYLQFTTHTTHGDRLLRIPEEHVYGEELTTGSP